MMAQRVDLVAGVVMMMRLGLRRRNAAPYQIAERVSDVLYRRKDIGLRQEAGDDAVSRDQREEGDQPEKGSAGDAAPIRVSYS